MPQHVWTCTGNDRPSQPAPSCVQMPIRQRVPRSFDKHVGTPDSTSLLLPPQELEPVHLIPLQVMDAIGAALEPADNNGALRQVDVIPAQITSLRRRADR